MARLSFLFNLLILVISVYSMKQDIPNRCIEHSVTEISCAQVYSEDSLLPHPDDCNLFYYCVSPDHSPICRQCPADLHFNPDKHVCDNPKDAGCILNGSFLQN